MQYIGMLFAILGCGLHIRMLGWIGEPYGRDLFASGFYVAPFINKILTLAMIVFPFVYYGLCIYSCTSLKRTAASQFTVVCVITIALFYFGNLHAELPGVAKNSFWAGVFTFPYFFAKPISRRIVATLTEENIPGSTTSEPKISSKTESENPYAPPQSEVR
jgi:hypothetical protein